MTCGCTYRAGEFLQGQIQEFAKGALCTACMIMLLLLCTCFVCGVTCKELLTLQHSNVNCIFKHIHILAYLHKNMRKGILLEAQIIEFSGNAGADCEK